MTQNVQYYSPAQEKFKRIFQLKDWGFNIPRMLYIPQEKKFYKEKLEKFFKDNPKELYNIRTYEYNINTGEEGWSSRHYTGLIKNDIYDTLGDIVENCYCMVDAEVAEDGVYAGNIVIQENDICVLEYFHGARAMVRMADRTLTGNLKDVKKQIIKEVNDSLLDVIDKVMISGLRDIVFEWSILRRNGGIKLEKLIWWEFRNWLNI